MGARCGEKDLSKLTEKSKVFSVSAASFFFLRASSFRFFYDLFAGDSTQPLCAWILHFVKKTKRGKRKNRQHFSKSFLAENLQESKELRKNLASFTQNQAELGTVKT